MTTPIPFHDFGGQGPLVHFAHANGFPPACFRQMIAPLLPHYRVLGLYHRPLWPGSQPQDIDDWRAVAADMIRFFEQEALQNMIGIGHSLGAVATMYVAIERPSLFQKIVLIEPVFLPPALLEMVEAHREVANTIPLVVKTRNRRRRWPGPAAAFTYLRAKSTFARWSDEALWDYVNNGMHQDEDGRTVLTYTPEWEARIYTLVSTDVWEVVPTISHPTLAIRGAESDTLYPQSWQLWQTLQPQASFAEVKDAGHMVVMEQPTAVAGHILNFLQT